ncbi:MAG: threonine dehydratase [Polyangiales bacterium]|jgi:threonine dehydratase
MTTPVWTIAQEHIAAAVATSQSHALRSPLVPAPWLGENTWLKLELELPTGSFKIRGALTFLSQHHQRAKREGLVAASAGNHGLGLAYAARHLSLPLRIFVSAGLPDVKLNGMRGLGAELVLCEENEYDAVEARARAEAERSGGLFASPFDDPFVAAGNGSAAMMEVLEAIPTVARVVVPVGGGGLLAGVSAALLAHGAKVECVGVESDASDAMARSLRSGTALETLAPRGPTLAEGLEGGISASTLHAAQVGSVRSEVVSEENIAQAMLALRKHLGRLVEGSGAAPVAWARRSENHDAPGATVLWVTGGNVDGHRVDALAEGWRPGQVTPRSSEE